MKTFAIILLATFVLWIPLLLVAQGSTDLFPVRGFAIAAPQSKEVDRFVKFIHEELASKNINTLILRVDFNYQYESYPQLRDSLALSKTDVKKIVDACTRDNIRIIPQINLLGHQSWAGRIGNLLRQFPDFDETPAVKMPAVYAWPNADGLYCKSYCPLHPDVHAVVFALVDEVCAAFGATAFHAGMDEVFYIGDARCPRCSGQDPSDLFANEVTLISNHLTASNRELWMWGDRFIDGKTTGMGMWEASMNNTFRAIDRVPKSIVICDWHYERPDPTAVYFAMKGFRVVTCPWNNSSVAKLQVENIARLHQQSSSELRPRFYGMVQTVWSGVGNFLDGYYGIGKSTDSSREQSEAFRTMTATMQSLSIPGK
jgi:Glycosyl hydrolase family 20, catalytic domain